MSFLNKTLGAVSFLCFFSFGLLSISFAACQDVPPPGQFQYVSFHHHNKSHGLAQAERNNFKGGMLIEDEGILPKPSRDFSAVRESVALSVRIPQVVWTPEIFFAPQSSFLNFSPVLNL